MVDTQVNSYEDIRNKTWLSKTNRVPFNLARCQPIMIILRINVIYFRPLCPHKFDDIVDLIPEVLRNLIILLIHGKNNYCQTHKNVRNQMNLYLADLAPTSVLIKLCIYVNELISSSIILSHRLQTNVLHTLVILFHSQKILLTIMLYTSILKLIFFKLCKNICFN